MPPIKVKQMGAWGVNADKNPLELDDNELQRAQNAVSVEGTGAGIRKRPGLAIFDTNDNEGPILGGISVPIIDSFSGFSVLFLGRGGEVV